VVASGIAALAIEKGGHVRVGLEDHYAPPRLARNADLVAEIAALCRSARRPPATVEDAPKILFG
jgi:3-keto-5-aminohexanoate cleavage enzyme